MNNITLKIRGKNLKQGKADCLHWINRQQNRGEGQKPWTS